MSLLSDLLSRVSHPEHGKDVPPGLKSTIADIKAGEPGKIRFVFLSTFFVFLVISGFAAVYFIESYYGAGIPKSPDATSKAQKPPGRDRLSMAESKPRTQDSKRPWPAVRVPVANDKAAILQTPAAKKKDTRLQMHSQAGRTEKRVIHESRVIVVKSGRLSGQKSFQTVEGRPVDDKKMRPAEAGEAGIERHEGKSAEKDSYLYLAENYERRKDFSNALSSYKKALDAEPGNYRVMNKIAYIFLQIGLYEEAIRYLQDALDIRHDYIPALINAGIAYAKTGRFPDAEGSILKALSLEKTSQAALLNIAITYEMQGRYDLARNYYSKLQRMGNEQGRSGIDRIKALTSE